MFQIKLDPKAILGNLSNLEQKQLPFAAALGLNRIAIVGQRAEQEHIRQTFKLRRSSFVLQGIKIEKGDRATKSSWSVVIRINVDRDFLDRMEDGTTKYPTHGRWLWKPNNEVFNNTIIMRSNPLHPANLKFNARMQGQNGTFMVHRKTTKDMGPLVLQRVAKGARGISQSIARGGMRGPAGRDAKGKFTPGESIKGIRRGGVRLLYMLVSRTRVPRKLEFVSTITQAVSTSWHEVMTQAMTDALRSAK